MTTQITKQSMAHGGVATRAACRTMEITVCQWLALKYKWVGNDEHGAAIYEVHPHRWADGDYDFAVRWNQFYTRPEHERTMHELGVFVEEARKRKVDTLVMNALFPIKREIPWYFKAGALIGGFFVFKWLLSPPEMKPIPGVQKINTKNIEDAFQEMAGGTAKPEIKLPERTTQLPEPEKSEK